jgi:hypothetical protein
VPPSPELAVCALATRGFRAQARALFASVRRHHPDAACYLLAVDEPADAAWARDLAGVSILRPDDVLPPAVFWGRVARYDAYELCTSLKPALLRRVAAAGHRHVVFLDVDMVLFAPLDACREALAGQDVLVTPHVLAPLPDDGEEPRELSIFLAGAINSGFVALRSGPGAEAFLAWWDAKLDQFCWNAPERGHFGDQKWLDLAVTMFEGVGLWRHPGYNVASWNLDQRPLSRRGDRYMVGEHPLVCFHLSGFDPTCPSRLSRYRSRPVPEPSRPALDAILASCAGAWLEGGYADDRRGPDGLHAFSNGVPFDARARRLLAQWLADGRAYPRPLDVAAEPSFWTDLTHTPAGRPSAYEADYRRERPRLRALAEAALLHQKLGVWRWLRTYLATNDGDWELRPRPGRADAGPDARRALFEALRAARRSRYGWLGVGLKRLVGQLACRLAGRAGGRSGSGAAGAE